MCGIYGSVGKPAWLGRLRPEEAVASMTHRGPDGSGVWRSPSLAHPEGGATPACVLGHARLSIIDLTEAGRQPMVSSDGRYALVYNGEAYNFVAIRRELESLGEAFTSTGDTEVVLKACIRWGERAPERFRGMFALGFWDERERSLLLARDRLGIKPLYVAAGPEGLSFASEVRTLLAAGAARRLLSTRGLLGYMRYGSLQEPDTLIEGVRSLCPGTTLVFDGTAVRETTYWSIPSEPAVRATRAEAISRISALLRESVGIRLVADVPFGIFLSGGIDSSAVAALASAESSQPVHTFTVVFDEATHSEERYATELAARFGCRHHSVRVTGEDAAADLDTALADQDQPSGDGLNSWLVSRAARREGLAMALSGLGGDEVFAGYPNFRRFGQLKSLSRMGRVVPRALKGRLDRCAARPKAPHALRKGLAVLDAGGSGDRVHSALRALLTDDQVRSLMPGPAWRSLVGARAPSALDAPAGDPVNEYSRLELSGYLRNTLLRDTDVMSMASSLEVRVPFLDHLLVEYVLSLPGELKLEGEGNKALLSESVGGLPVDIGRRPKMGFVLPIEAWFRGPMRSSMEDRLLELPGPAAGILRRKPVEEAWRAFLEGDGTVSATRLFALASLSAWVSRHDLVLPW